MGVQCGRPGEILRSYRPVEFSTRSSGIDTGMFVEYRVRPQTTLRVELNNLLDSHFKPYREYYTYPSVVTPPPLGQSPAGWPVNPQIEPPRLFTAPYYVETADFHNGRSVFVSLRRNF